MDYHLIKTLLNQMASVPETTYLASATKADVERTMRLYEILTAEVREIEAEIAIEKYQLSLIEDQIELSLRQNLSAARSIVRQRRCTDIHGALSEIESWLAAQLSQDSISAS